MAEPATSNIPQIITVRRVLVSDAVAAIRITGAVLL